MAFDLSGILHVQRYFVTNLPIGGNSGDKVTKIQNNLNTLYDAYNGKYSSSQGLISNQNKLNDILTDEKDRLDAKKDEINKEIAGRKRIVDLNESYRKKQAQYVYIIIVLIFALLLYIILVNIKYFIPVIPNFVIDLLTFFLGALTSLYLYVLIKDIYSRDNMNYDQLDLPAPVQASDDDVIQKQRAAQASGDLLGSIANPNTCVGENCCVPEITTWEAGIGKCIRECDKEKEEYYNTSTNKCESSVNTAIYTICGGAAIPKGQTCFIKDGFTNYTSENTKPYAPSEYINYSKL